MWENFRGLFRAINTGNTALNIPAYNGGLFADDPDLDRLTVPDPVCRYFQAIADYDYRSPHEVVHIDEMDGNKLVDVDILSHIFEQSITDLELLRNELDGLTEQLGPAEHASRRKKRERSTPPPSLQATSSARRWAVSWKIASTLSAAGTPRRLREPRAGC